MCNDAQVLRIESLCLLTTQSCFDIIHMMQKLLSGVNRRMSRKCLFAAIILIFHLPLLGLLLISAECSPTNTRAKKAQENAPETEETTNGTKEAPEIEAAEFIAQEYKSKGDVYFRANDYRKAIESYTEAIALFTDNNEKARLYEKMTRLYIMCVLRKQCPPNYKAKIIEVLEKALNLYTKNEDKAKTYKKIGVHYHYSLKNYEKAIESYTKAIALHTDNKQKTNDYIALAEITSKLRNYHKAIEHYTEAIKYNEAKKALIYQYIGTVYRDGLKDYRKAIEYYTKVIALFKEEDIVRLSSGYKDRAKAYLLLGNKEEAAQDTERAEITEREVSTLFKKLYYPKKT